MQVYSDGPDLHTTKSYNAILDKQVLHGCITSITLYFYIQF